MMALVAGCGGSATPVLECSPACPAGAHCTESGCVLDGPGVDLAASTDGPGTPACASVCAGATPHCSPKGVCVPCLDDSHCPVGQVCKSVGQTSICAMGCSDDSRCGAPGGPMKCCNGACMDTTKDAQNCGACGTVCSRLNARSTCEAGQCMVGACDPGWGDCNHDATDGCEVNLRSDPSNCTACGMVCSVANAGAGCSNGCYLRSCNFGFDDCDGNEKNGCELNVLSNNQNCGSCGTPCAGVPHAKNNCVNGACQLISCDAGYSDCDGMLVNGCEAATNTDANNCGRCANKCGQGLICAQALCTCPNCNLPNAKSTCVNLQCAVAQCNVNWGDCDGLPQNGCEQNLVNDARNCGQCGLACAQGLVCVNGSCTCPNCVRANGKTACVNNMCMLDSCFPDYGNCNGNDGDGCETDLTVDAQNCGQCGLQCPMNAPYCLKSVCSAVSYASVTMGGGGNKDVVFVYAPAGTTFVTDMDYAAWCAKHGFTQNQNQSNNNVYVQANMFNNMSYYCTSYCCYLGAGNSKAMQFMNGTFKNFGLPLNSPLQVMDRGCGWYGGSFSLGMNTTDTLTVTGANTYMFNVNARGAQDYQKAKVVTFAQNGVVVCQAN